MTGYGMRLFDQHQEVLAVRGIDPDVARERGLVTADTKARLASLGFAAYQQRIPAMVIPLLDVDGDTYGFQVRPDQPREDQHGRAVKYETPEGQRLRLDVHPRSRALLRRRSEPLVITEGTLKADAAVSRGMCALGLAGVYGWRDADGVLPDWEQVGLKGRIIYLAFDSDVTVKPQVRQALARLSKWLESKGADVQIVLFPAGDDGSKTGLDDWLAADPSRHLNELKELVGEPVDLGAETFSGTVITRSGLKHLPHVEEAVEGLLSRPSAALLVGATGLGKSVLVTGILASAATGRDWLGRRVNPGPVLLVVGEGAHGLDARLTAWEEAWSTEVPDDQFHVSVRPDSLLHKGWWDELTAFAQETGCAFVVIDTLSTCFPDADETRDAPKIMRRLSDLASAISGVALLVHHPGWANAGRSRGGYQFEANADEVLVLTGVAEGSPVLALTKKKAKEGPSGAVTWLRRREMGNSIIIEHARPNDAELPIRDRILTMLTALGDVGASGPQMILEAGVGEDGTVPRSSFYRTMHEVQKDGLVKKKGRVYYLAADAPEGAE